MRVVVEGIEIMLCGYKMRVKQEDLDAAVLGFGHFEDLGGECVKGKRMPRPFV